MPRTKQRLKTRAKNHRSDSMRTRKKKNRLRANQRRARNKPRRRLTSKK